ncbi:uncharacterized protein LOC131619746 [Vicia villosa]|uniref:uncharacterized protein LOC131619746 n=1 Tax=Vicia villosa TaxID=3911 RepID=UPI00273CE349|nr:uncharacterized protein LOC131619746 [Vicia villosa]
MASSSLQQEKGNHGDDTGNIVLKKGTWSSQEDQVLVEYVKNYGARKWDSVRKKTKLIRDGKSCRLRWLNHLKPTLKKCSFSEEEKEELISLYKELGPKWSGMVSKFPGRTDNELKNFINSRKRSLKNSRKNLARESINHVDELNDNVGEIRLKKGSSNQNNNAFEEEEMTLPRVEFDHQNIMHANYLNQIYDEANINFKPLSTLIDDPNMLYNNVGSFSLSNSREFLIPESINLVDELIDDIERLSMMKGSSNQNNIVFEEEEMTLPRMDFDDQDILYANYLDPIYEEANINFEPFSTLVDNSNMQYNNVGSFSLSNSREFLIPESINNVDQLIASVGEFSMMKDSSNQNNNASEEEMTLPRVESNHQDIMHANYLEENINFEQISTLVDDSNMLYNNVESSSLSNHIVPALNDRFSTHPECSYFQNEKNINNLEPLSKLDDDLNMPYNNVENTSLSMAPDLLTLPECSHIQDREDTLPSFPSCNMVFDQDLPPIPQCSYNLDMDYQLPSEMFFDQYPQNPIQSSDEIQYEILEPWLLAECVPFWPFDQ